jgi:hypothetical protein
MWLHLEEAVEGLLDRLDFSPATVLALARVGRGLQVLGGAVEQHAPRVFAPHVPGVLEQQLLELRTLWNHGEIIIRSSTQGGDMTIMVSSIITMQHGHDL